MAKSSKQRREHWTKEFRENEHSRRKLARAFLDQLSGLAGNREDDVDSLAAAFDAVVTEDLAEMRRAKAKRHAAVSTRPAPPP